MRIKVAQICCGGFIIFIIYLFSGLQNRYLSLKENPLCSVASLNRAIQSLQQLQTHDIDISETITTLKSVSLKLRAECELLTDNDTSSRLRVNKQEKYYINCANIHQIQVIRKGVASGRFRTTDIGIFRGQKVAIKRITGRTKETSHVRTLRYMLFMKEILLLLQLKNPGLIKMLGYCLKSLEHDSYASSPRDGEIAAVYEYGERFDTNISRTPDRRLKQALDLAELLLYLKNSPLGSLVIGDFAKHHFLLVNDSVKLIDLDYMHNIEAPCSNYSEQLIGSCDFKLPCLNGVCRGYNARINLINVHNAFLRELMSPELFPTVIREMVTTLFMRLNMHHLSASELVQKLKDIIETTNNLQKSDKKINS